MRDGEELLGGEKAAEDENVSNETEFVEKGISGDFFTPEKLEEDANKSTKVTWYLLHHYDVEAKCLLDLLNKDGWLTREHTGEWQIHAQSPRKEEFKFSKSLLKYVDGSIPELGKSWKDCRYLYAPCCAIGSHCYSTEKFKFVKMKEVPQQHNGSDCGIFTVKYIEFLQANMDVCAIRPEYIPMWRNKLAAELLAWHFEP
ncbi:Cysteine proteinases superfamily protein [Abeliophyllum distichum]|uniref:Cysteine proteinases superfamily protein n=1 Tax=Abeliophyllum distichum TaxID=126358 RepID=A0ABD1TJ31_9LAMI